MLFQYPFNTKLQKFHTTPYLQFVKFLIIPNHGTQFLHIAQHCTNNEFLYSQQNHDNIQRTRFEEIVAEDLLHQSKQT